MSTPPPAPGPVPVRFDPDAGLLRLPHGTLAVLALLAADPVDPRLHDHDVAPHVAALRAAGVLGRSGFHDAVRPLTDAVGAARASLDLAVADRNEARRCRGWVAADLVVVAVPTADDAGVFDLVADAPAALPALVDDLVGLVPGSGAPPGSETLRVDADGFERLVARGATATPVDVGDALQREEGGTTPDATGSDTPVAGGPAAAEVVAALAAGLAARWALTVTPRDGTAAGVAVLDAGASGLWLEVPEGSALLLSPTDALAVHERVTALVDGVG